METTLKVAAVQMNSSDRLEANLDTCRSLIARAADEGARFVALPENFAFMGSEAAKRDLAEGLDGEPGPIRRLLESAAREFGVYILGGGWPLVSGDVRRPFNAATLHDPQGRLLATYRKIHLFDVDAPDGISYRESDGVTPGDQVVCVAVDGFRVGLSICYDIRFPELYRKLVDQHADIICIPAAFTAATGQAHWEVLCRARAIESQCYVVAPGQTGSHLGNRRTHGHSLIVSPWGDILADAGTGEAVVLSHIEHTNLTSIRTKLPCLQHRRSL